MCGHDTRLQIPGCHDVLLWEELYAIAAALTAWREEHTVQLFVEANLEQFFGDKSDNSVDWEQAYSSLWLQLNDWFVHEDREKKSIFSDGDVDIFLQASPATKAPLEKLKPILIDGVTERLVSFIGGLEFVHGDLQRAAMNFDESTMQPHCREYDQGFAMALAYNGLSWQYACGEHSFPYVGKTRSTPWPRNDYDETAG